MCPVQTKRGNKKKKKADNARNLRDYSRIRIFKVLSQKTLLKMRDDEFLCWKIHIEYYYNNFTYIQFIKQESDQENHQKHSLMIFLYSVYTRKKGEKEMEKRLGKVQQEILSAIPPFTAASLGEAFDAPKGPRYEYI